MHKVPFLLVALGLAALTAGCLQDSQSTYSSSRSGPVYTTGSAYNPGYTTSSPRYTTDAPRNDGSWNSARRDSDRDGIPNRYDSDANGDGVPDRYQGRPVPR